MYTTIACPLHLAAFKGNVAAIELLLQYGANINKEDPNLVNTSTAISTALWAKMDAAASVLLENGADVNIDGFEFISNGSLDVLRKIVAAGLSKEAIQNALCWAAAQADYGKVQFFLEHGADANGTYSSCEAFEDRLNSSKDTSGRRDISWNTGNNEEPLNPLVNLIAHEFGSADDVPQILDLLIDKGADVNRIAACHYCYADDVFHQPNGGLLVNMKRKITPLMTAAYYGMTAVINVLLEREALINLIVERNTALTSAVESESYQLSSTDTYTVVKHLIEHGANPQLCDVQVVKRIEKLLAMSSEERELMTAFQNLVRLSQFDQDPYNDNKKTHRERRRLLEQLIENGADSRLCCARDEKNIHLFLNWTEQDLDKRDQQMKEDMDRMERYRRGPLS